MKIMLTTLSYSLILSAPLLLSGCESMDNLFGRSDAADYTYSKPAPHTTFKHSSTTPAPKTETTRLVEPGISTVNTPPHTAVLKRNATDSVKTASDANSSAASTTSSVPVTGPMVPSMAPSVSQ